MTFPTPPTYDPWQDERRFVMGGDSPRLREIEGPILIEKFGPLQVTTFPDGDTIHFNRARLAL